MCLCIRIGTSFNITQKRTMASTTSTDMNIWNEFSKLCLHHLYGLLMRERRLTEHSNHIRLYYTRTPKHTLLATCNYRRFSSTKKKKRRNEIAWINEWTAKVIAPVCPLVQPKPNHPTFCRHSTTSKIESILCLHRGAYRFYAVYNSTAQYTSLSTVRTKIPQLFLAKLLLLLEVDLVLWLFRWAPSRRRQSSCVTVVCVCVCARKSTGIVISVDRNVVWCTFCAQVPLSRR